MNKNYVVIFFSYSAFHTQKFSAHYKEQNKKKSWQLAKRKVIQSKKMSKKCPKKLKIYSLNIYKAAGIKKKPKPLIKVTSQKF